MKRDIKLNMSNLRAILYKINEYKSELEVIESASIRFLETIKEQDSKAYDRLAALWERNVTLNERDLREKLETISKILNNYICDMESYLTPNNPSAMMRVDRNDIWRNCGQIEQNTVYESYFDEILCDTSSSFADYKQCFVYNPFEDEETNNARKAVQQAEEEAERKRREANYAQLEDFRTTLSGKMQGSLKTSVDNIWKMYEEVIIPFENTDDEYKKKLDGYYDEWSDIGDKFRDVTDVIADVGKGFGYAVSDLVTGIGSLISGVGKLLGWLTLQAPIIEECGLVPETLEETWEQELKETWTGIKAILSEPEDALGAIAQGVIDTADEKGVAYSVGYVTTDIVCGILLDKGLGKVSKLGKTDDVVKYVDEVAESASKAGKHADGVAKKAKEAANGVGKGCSKSLNVDELVVKDSKFLDADGNIEWEKWAPNGGRVAGTIKENQTISVGTVIDRYGNQWGKYTSPVGVPYEQRALPYIENSNAYHKYIVLKPIDNVTISEIAPAFDQIGGGIQYELPYNIKKLKELGYIKEIN